METRAVADITKGYPEQLAVLAEKLGAFMRTQDIGATTSAFKRSPLDRSVWTHVRGPKRGARRPRRLRTPAPTVQKRAGRIRESVLSMRRSEPWRRRSPALPSGCVRLASDRP